MGLKIKTTKCNQTIFNYKNKCRLAETNASHTRSTLQSIRSKIPSHSRISATLIPSGPKAMSTRPSMALRTQRLYHVSQFSLSCQKASTSNSQCVPCSFTEPLIKPSNGVRSSVNTAKSYKVTSSEETRSKPDSTTFQMVCQQLEVYQLARTTQFIGSSILNSFSRPTRAMMYSPESRSSVNQCKPNILPLDFQDRPCPQLMLTIQIKLREL